MPRSKSVIFYKYKVFSFVIRKLDSNPIIYRCIVYEFIDFCTDMCMSYEIPVPQCFSFNGNSQVESDKEQHMSLIIEQYMTFGT